MAEADAGAERRGEPVRVGTGADGFPHGSKYPLFVGAGMLFTALGLVWPLALVIGVPVLLYGMAGWTYEYTVVEFERGVIPEQKRQLLGVETGLLAMYVVILGELLIFAALFVAWFYLRAERGPFPPAGYPAPSLTLGAVLAVTMLAGSLSLHFGRRALQQGRRRPFSTGYAIAFVAGLVFLVVLWTEWSALIAGGVDWTTGPYGASYYALTGLHGLHVVTAVALIGVVLVRAWLRGHFSANRNLMPRTTEAFWHFLTVVSVLILAFVYLPSA